MQVENITSDHESQIHAIYLFIYLLERFSNECLKTKTKVITLANQKGRRQSSKPIKSRSNYTVTDTKRGKMCTREPRLVLVSLVIG